jgi:branched-chain amino acid transport system substrate-binding protein
MNQSLRIGLLADVQGEFGVVGDALLHGTQLAIEEINAAGGARGCRMELIHLDPDMSIDRYEEYARRLTEQEKVDVVIGGILSAQRETVRAIVNRTDALYMYTNVYEGGVCDGSMICIGAVPEQQLATSIPWMMEKFGKRVYTIAIENPFGKGSAAWTRDLVARHGGKMVGEEFFPIGSSQFAPTVQRILLSKPDWIMCLNGGVSQDAFFLQAAEAGLSLPMLSSFRIMLTYDHKRLPKPVLDKMHVTASWVEEMDTPAANVFKARWRAKFPNEIYISAMGYNAYAAVHLYKALVEKAASTRKADLRKVIAAGDASFDGPGGRMRVDPKSQHTAQHMRLFIVGPDHVVSEAADFGMVEPSWLGEVGCDLTREDPQTQYSPSRLPSR